MRKAWLPALALVLALMVTVPAFALGMTFTHPEIGEPMTVSFVNGMPLFKIYGFTYYQIVDPMAPYRGLLVNRSPLVGEGMPGLEESLGQVLDSAETESGQAELSFSMTGIAAEYAEQLDALPRAEKINAILLLNGFSGLEGYAELKAIPGFETMDVSGLSETYLPFSVRVGERRYEYRVLQFSFADDENHEYYVERYAYLKVDGQWRLARIAREFADQYESRQLYVHGVAGFALEPLYDVHYEAMQELEWGAPVEAAASLNGAVMDGNAVGIPETTLFRIPCSVSFSHSNGVLNGITYTLRNEQSYYSAFISLYMRYADPVTVSPEGDMTWSLNDTYIELIYEKDQPIVRLTQDTAEIP